MNVINSETKVLLDIPTIETDSIRKKLSTFFSIFSILFLVCVIVVFSVLIFNLVNSMQSQQYTVTYTGESAVQEPQVLRVDF